MTWFKVDDKLHDHQKPRLAGPRAMGLWVLAGSWSADNLTNGFIPTAVLSRWGTPKDAAQLVKAGLWTEAVEKGETGWMFHDWAEYQPTRQQVREKRQANADRLRKWREKHRGDDDEQEE